MRSAEEAVSNKSTKNCHCLYPSKVKSLINAVAKGFDHPAWSRSQESCPVTPNQVMLRGVRREGISCKQDVEAGMAVAFRGFIEIIFFSSNVALSMSRQVVWSQRIRNLPWVSSSSALSLMVTYRLIFDEYYRLILSRSLTGIVRMKMW